MLTEGQWSSSSHTKKGGAKEEESIYIYSSSLSRKQVTIPDEGTYSDQWTNVNCCEAGIQS